MRASGLVLLILGVLASIGSDALIAQTAISADGVVESTAGGFKFPDATVQTTSGVNLPFASSASVGGGPVFSIINSSTSASSIAVTGIISSPTPGGFSTAVRGENRGTADNGIGVWGSQAGNGWGVYGRVDGSGGRAVYGSSSNGWAGYFVGNVNVTGSISKGSGSFKIDHPLDPENKFLYHSFVESPDMMNVYNGNVVLDAFGEAEVLLPEWFEALNVDYRYQLTAIGGPGPNLYVATEIAGNTFRIAGGESGLKVSWQVTGIRNDAYARHKRIPVEEDKPSLEQGFYLHPRAFGLEEDRGIEQIYDLTQYD